MVCYNLKKLLILTFQIVNLFGHYNQILKRKLLCIATSKRVLSTLFAGQNHLFRSAWELWSHFTPVFKKMILPSERHAEHPFAGQNTQQKTYLNHTKWGMDWVSVHTKNGWNFKFAHLTPKKLLFSIPIWILDTINMWL